MQTQEFAPASAGPRTILLGRNRLSTDSEIPAAVVKSFDNRGTALRPSRSLRKGTARASVGSASGNGSHPSRFDLVMRRDWEK